MGESFESGEIPSPGASVKHELLRNTYLHHLIVCCKNNKVLSIYNTPNEDIILMLYDAHRVTVELFKRIVHIITQLLRSGHHITSELCLR